ncbi:DUF2956 domain-containing protein [Thalassotalea nanhaiensis]|uniref:DUF2956 domain-containing protein n=1 Tax=Thalassotalea nanhaiensis TaxID=3065648 RepID=A0ABY9TLH6_9GAMM|nr:DUF2956 domain-containing protein [Colwelliaceae bacterium SQ345]
MTSKTKAPSSESIKAAETMAKSIQKPGQTKEQTKLIAQGIQKGIEQYKKQQKAKARDADKAKKKQQKAKSQNSETNAVELQDVQQSKLAWVLLAISWLGFIAYLILV